MAVIVKLPVEVEQRLRAAVANLDLEAKEAMLVGLFRQDRISRHELSAALGLGRLETDAVLKRHHVTEHLPTCEELAEDFLIAQGLLAR